MVSKSLVTGLALFAATALAAPTASIAASPIPGYTIEDFEWEVETTPGGPKFLINGTIENVLSKLAEANPNYAADHKLDLSPATTPDAAAEVVSALSKRQVEGHICRGQWAEAESHDIQDGINHLRGVGGRPTRHPGPGSCGRVACNGYAGIWWCNDNTFQFTLSSFGSIANGAEFLINNCERRVGQFPWTKYYVGGQVFYRDKWNVIVREDKC